MTVSWLPFQHFSGVLEKKHKAKRRYSYHTNIRINLMCLLTIFEKFFQYKQGHMKPIPIPSFIILHYIFPPMRYNKNPSPNSNREMSQKLKFKMKICKLQVSKAPFNFRNNHISSCGTPTSRRCSLLIFHRAGYT